MPRPTLTRWVRPRSVLLALGLALLPLGAVLVAQTATPSSVTRLAASGDVAAGWGRRLEDLQRAGTLRLRSSREDTMIDGRVHDRFDQYAGEVPIFGAQVVRQRSGAGVETVFGDLYPEDLGISLTPGSAPNRRWPASPPLLAALRSAARRPSSWCSRARTGRSR